MIGEKFLYTTSLSMFHDIQSVLIITMIEIYSRDIKTCLCGGGEIEDFPRADVFKMIIQEAGNDTRLLYIVGLHPRCKELLLKITHQVRDGNFEPACVGKKLAVLRSLFRFSQLLNAAV